MANKRKQADTAKTTTAPNNPAISGTTKVASHQSPGNEPKPKHPDHGGGTSPKNPCAAAAAQVDYALSNYCNGLQNSLEPCCNCPEDEHLPHLESLSDGHLLNTATDGAGGVLATGLNDIQWEISSDSGVTWAPAVVTHDVGWTNGPINGSDWIADGTGPKSQSVYLFRTRFVLCGDVSNRGFSLQAKVLADNIIEEIYVNGATQGGISATGFRDPVPIDLNHNWKSCVNEIIFQVRNGTGPMGFLASFNILAMPKGEEHNCDCNEKCQEFSLPDVAPCFSVHWGNSDCDCFETNDFEVLCITACNCYSNLTFEQLTIGMITVTDALGNPVPTLPDGSSSVMVVPMGPICFGDLGPCVDGKPACKSRQFAIHTCGALPGGYKLKFDAICYRVAFALSSEACFKFHLCKD